MFIRDVFFLLENFREMGGDHSALTTNFFSLQNQLFVLY